MADPYAGSDSVQASARRSAVVTPHASNALDNVPKALYVGGAGDIVCRLVDDSSDRTFVGVTAGAILPIRPSHVRATGTTATNIVALY